MLLNVHVKNLALIEDVDICFGDGLNILSGETGAGKSMIIGSVKMALGGKIPKDIIRKNQEYGLVELIFSIDDERIKNKLIELGVVFDENELIISRRISGVRTINKVNGESVTGTFIKNLSSYLLDVHGQHDHESLLNKSKHIEILDAFIGEEGQKLKEQVSEQYTRIKKLKNELDTFDMDEETRKREMDFLSFEISELEDANLIVGEDEQLEAKQKEFLGIAKIMDTLSTVSNILSNDNGLTTITSYLSKELMSIKDINKDTASLYEQIMDIDSLCQDFSNDVVGYTDSLSYDEEYIKNVSDRLDVINKLKLKHGRTIEDILLKYKELKKKLSVLINYEESINNINAQIIEQKDTYFKYAKKLSDCRRNAAKMLSKDIVDVLLTLNFSHVQFDVAFDNDNMNMTDNMISPKGIDSPYFIISLNPGESMKPLADIASGGELSRVMLGIKTILADVDNIDTLIFDEIDTGISGKTAGLVAEKMNIISKHHQVICITHLPQIASMADNHFVIEKVSTNDITKTDIRKMNADEEIMELARMLGGVEITQTTIDNAKEMKKIALNQK